MTGNSPTVAGSDGDGAPESDRATRTSVTVGADEGETGGRSRSRAQTTLDFAIGTSVFLLVLIAVVQFVPGMLQPFNVGAQEETVAVNRVADQLAGSLLGDPARQYAMDKSCTVAFFKGINNPSGCRYSGGTLNERLGVKSRQHVNVTLKGNITGTDGVDVLCWDEDDNKLIERQDFECGPSSSDVVFSIGPHPRSGSISTVTGRRTVSLDGNQTTLVVEMW